MLDLEANSTTGRQLGEYLGALEVDAERVVSLRQLAEQLEADPRRRRAVVEFLELVESVSDSLKD